MTIFQYNSDAGLVGRVGALRRNGDFAISLDNEPEIINIALSF